MYLMFNFLFMSLEETEDALLVTFLLKKPYFLIFYMNCLINISPYFRALVNLRSQ